MFISASIEMTFKTMLKSWQIFSIMWKVMGKCDHGKFLVCLLSGDFEKTNYVLVINIVKKVLC